MSLTRRKPDSAQRHQACKHLYLQKLEREAGRLRTVEGALKRVNVRVHERRDTLLHVAGTDQRREVQPQKRHLVSRVHYLRNCGAEASVPGRELLFACDEDQGRQVRPNPESLLGRPAERRRADVERGPEQTAVGDGPAGAPEGRLQDQRSKTQRQGSRSPGQRRSSFQARKGCC